MKILKHILYFIGWLLLFPFNALVDIFFVGPMRNKGAFNSIEWDWNSWSWKIDIYEEYPFFKKRIENWWGFVIGNYIFYVEYSRYDDDNKKQIKHEETHVLQNYIFNILFYPAYILCSGFIWLFLKNKHAYLDNPFERWARKSADQEVNISKENWMNGPNDRWPWW